VDIVLVPDAVVGSGSRATCGVVVDFHILTASHAPKTRGRRDGFSRRFGFPVARRGPRTRSGGSEDLLWAARWYTAERERFRRVATSGAVRSGDESRGESGCKGSFTGEAERSRSGPLGNGVILSIRFDSEQVSAGIAAISCLIAG
jgi:hypothetical protein